MRQFRHPEAGLTLMELMVSMAVGLVLIAMISKTFVSHAGHIAASTAEAREYPRLSLVADQIETALRNAVSDPMSEPGTTPPLVSGNPATDIRVRTLVGNSVQTRRYYIQNGSLLMDIDPATPGQVHTLLEHVRTFALLRDDTTSRALDPRMPAPLPNMDSVNPATGAPVQNPAYTLVIEVDYAAPDHMQHTDMRGQLMTAPRRVLYVHRQFHAPNVNI